MKRLITILLCGAIICLPAQQTKSQVSPVVGAICITITAALIGTAICCVIRACAPKWYCVRGDGAGGVLYNCQTLNGRTEAAALGLEIISGPYTGPMNCVTNCGPPTATVARCLPCETAALAINQQTLTGTIQLEVQASVDLTNWTARLITNVTSLSDFVYAETNSVSLPRNFYRVIATY